MTATVRLPREGEMKKKINGQKKENDKVSQQQLNSTAKSLVRGWNELYTPLYVVCDNEVKPKSPTR